MREIVLARLAELIGGRVVGDGKILLSGVRSLPEAGPSDVSFFTDARYRPALESSRAGAVIAVPAEASGGRNWIAMDNPYAGFARALAFFTGKDRVALGVSPRAWVHPGAAVGKDPSIHPFAVVGEGAVLGDRVTLFPGVYVGPGAKVGDDTVLHPNVVLEEGTVVGKRVIVHAGTILGSDGFGYAQDQGRYVKIPQVGIVRVEDDAEIGANCAIDRAALQETVIGAGTKLDNLVHIAHNVRIGRDCALAGQVGIAGSSVLGDRVTMGGQSGIGGHLKVGNDVTVAGKSAAFKDLPDKSFVAGFPAGPISEWRRSAALFLRLDEMMKRIRELEKALGGSPGASKKKEE